MSTETLIKQAHSQHLLMRFLNTENTQNVSTSNEAAIAKDKARP
jgi:hypothetical protein